jgi:hypothetical protein
MVIERGTEHTSTHSAGKLIWSSAARNCPDLEFALRRAHGRSSWKMRASAKLRCRTVVGKICYRGERVAGRTTVILTTSLSVFESLQPGEPKPMLDD